MALGQTTPSQQIRCLEATQVLLGGGQSLGLQRPAHQGKGPKPGAYALHSHQHVHQTPYQNPRGRKPLRSVLRAILRAAPPMWMAHARQQGKRIDAPSEPANSNRIALVAVCRRVPTSGSTGWRGLSRMKGNFHVRFLEGSGLVTARSHSISVTKQS